MPPVSGATLPIAIVRVAGACAFLSSPQPVTPTMAAIAITPKWERIMAASGSRRSAETRLIMRTAHGAVNFPRHFTRRGETAAGSVRLAGGAGSPGGFRLLDRQNVFRQRFRIVIVDGAVRRPRDWGHHSSPALLSFFNVI